MSVSSVHPDVCTNWGSSRAASTSKLDPDERSRINRENARHSTGPRTADGKARSRLNAVKHGMTASLKCLPAECAEDHQMLVDELQQELQPATAMQHLLFTQIAQLAWRVRRLPQAEVALFESERGKALSWVERDMPLLPEQILARRMTKESDNGFLLFERYSRSMQTLLIRLMKEYRAMKKEGASDGDECHADRSAADVFDLDAAGSTAQGMETCGAVDGDRLEGDATGAGLDNSLGNACATEALGKPSGETMGEAALGNEPAREVDATPVDTSCEGATWRANASRDVIMANNVDRSVGPQRDRLREGAGAGRHDMGMPSMTNIPVMLYNHSHTDAD